ncbi:MAG: helix-turn-helix transcriptional regulator [Paludibacteraceae bacterium]|nr:helix-turn-helix transcriptional regulator [Paludibacteraceae bacterium]
MSEEIRTYGIASTNSLKKLAPVQRKLQRAIEHKKYRQKHLTLNSLAHDLNTNRTYLSDLVHQLFGMPFTDYINHLRVEDAKTILADTNCKTTIKTLAEELGYNSTTSFYRNFKRIVGMSATEYYQSIHGKEMDITEC